MFKHILLATDGSTASEHAATLALGMARSSGAQLTALYVIDPYPYMNMGEANPYGFDAYMAAAQQHASAVHAKVVAQGLEGEVKVAVALQVVEDVAAAHGIVHAAKRGGIDLIVMGSHGRGGIARLLLGSVANRVVAESSVPVLVAR